MFLNNFFFVGRKYFLYFLTKYFHNNFQIYFNDFNGIYWEIKKAPPPPSPPSHGENWIFREEVETSAAQDTKILFNKFTFFP